MAAGAGTQCQVHHDHHQRFRTFAETDQDRSATLGSRQRMIFNRPRAQAAEHAIAVLAEATEVAIELLIPVREGAELGQVFDLIDVAGSQAAAIGFLQGDQVEVAQQIADFLQIVGTPGVRQQMLPASGQVMPVPLGTDADLDIEAEQAQTAVRGQPRRFQVMFVDPRIMQANDAFGTPAAHGRPRA